MKPIFTIILFFATISTFAQQAMVKGKIVHEDTKLPYPEVSVTLPKAKVTTSTNAEGEYQLSNIAFGDYDMIISSEGNIDDTIGISVNSTVTIIQDIEIKRIEVNPTNLTADNSVTGIEDASSEDENTVSSSNQNVSSVLNASRDAYLSAATFGWGQYFYRIRGYENDNNLLSMNGVPMNDLEEGGVFYNSWSGLNDVFRGKSVTLGLAPNENNFGGLGLNTSLDASASNQRKGTRFTYTATNRSYRNRIMLTHSSGLMKSGWAYSFSFSRRWAQAGQIKGTFYDAWAYFGAIEKRFKKQGISLMIAGAPIRRGKAGPATKEVFDLAGTNYYNPYWGYQNGEIRNSRILTTHSPLFILSHDYRFSKRTILNTAVSYQFGETATTGIDWYNSADPRPDYYRYLPSYCDSAIDRKEVADRIRAKPDDYLQINWDRLYEANKLNKLGGYARSVYIVNENVEATKKMNAAMNLESVLTDHITIYTGVNFQNQNNHDFLRVVDLMGGDYWENINQFATRTFAGVPNVEKYDVNDVDVKRKEGDTYGMDYNIHFTKAAWFGQGVFTYNRIDFFAAAEVGYTGFYRNGNYKSGLYPTNSFGNSEKLTFLNYKGKGGLTFKINGRNYIYANGSFGTRAPFVDNVFISPRTRNSIIANPVSEKYTSGEAGYLFRSPNIKTRLTFFLTNVENASDIKRYYGDDSVSFVNMVLQGINKRYTGIEMGAEIKISPSFTLNLAGAYTQAFYTSRPFINVYSDNDTATTDLAQDYNGASDTVYMKNYYIPSGPQTTFQASLNYRSKRYWYASVSFNYLANNWMDFAPTRRTKDGVDLLEYQSSEWSAAIDQQKTPDFYTVDLFGGKSFKVNKYIKKASSNTYLNLNIGLSNVLNNHKIIQYGFENLRTNKENPEWFAPKYAYSLGIQYFLNLSLRF